MNAYADEVYENEQVRTSTKRWWTVLDYKYEKLDLNKAMENQYKNLIEV